MVYEIIPISLGRKFHPLYNLTNQGFFCIAQLTFEEPGDGFFVFPMVG